MSRRQLTQAVRDRYWRASKTAKTQILNEFVANTGYHRKYALAVLSRKHRPDSSAPRRRRPVTYTGDVSAALVTVWKVLDRIATRRLHPFLPEMVQRLERDGELHLADDTRSLLLQMSRATMDRLLGPARRAERPHGRSTTKPGTLLTQAIPIQTWEHKTATRPGLTEIDLVAHCGETTQGDYLATLNVLDLATAWCECIVPKNRGQQAVQQALAEVRQRLPCPLVGIHSDNGSEFINHHLKRYCDQETIDFTRGRSYKKNDQAHVEQKNWTVVRRYIGYDRYEGMAAQAALNDLYRDIRLYVNYFQPVMKLVSKSRVDGKTRKVYDTAQTPYQRMLTSPDVSDDAKQKLAAEYETINPVTLYRRIEDKLRKLWEIHAIRPGTAAA